MLIDDIIDILSHENASLTDALMKTKILLHNIGHKELIEWVNNELNGYADGKEIPPYRIVHSTVLGNVSNGVYLASSHPIPIRHLDKEQQESLEYTKMGDSLTSIEALLSRSGGTIARRIPIEFNYFLDQGLGNGFQTQNAWCEISISNVKSIMVNVRSRLLDFLLELRDKIGEGVTDANIKEKSRSIDAQGLFNHTIFGSNTTIIVGNQNSQTVSFNSKNINDLKEFLQQLKNELPQLNLLAGDKEQASEQVNSIESQLATTLPDINIIRKAGSVLYGILLGVGGNYATDLIKHLTDFLGKGF